MPMVAPMTATSPPPPVKVSSITVRVLFTSTFPSRIEHSRKLPMALIGWMAYRRQLLQEWLDRSSLLTVA